eukprot:CAMPEP_0185835474 /NCGR_PEP_ID=MMETSP1353-20130828/7836_1 /TAXON_ID=1077150 /ORGANISM="Erythrolobus australicus, Strain CCMP3124" /LENGTH=362 /DNA_ID=CAMNT_0028534103 /DNA_START=22 /DNA_END=1107 /DNA_ORIENTATION=+
MKQDEKTGWRKGSGKSASFWGMFALEDQGIWLKNDAAHMRKFDPSRPDEMIDKKRVTSAAKTRTAANEMMKLAAKLEGALTDEEKRALVTPVVTPSQQVTSPIELDEDDLEGADAEEDTEGAALEKAAKASVEPMDNKKRKAASGGVSRVKRKKASTPGKKRDATDVGDEVGADASKSDDGIGDDDYLLSTRESGGGGAAGARRSGRKPKALKKSLNDDEADGADEGADAKSPVVMPRSSRRRASVAAPKVEVSPQSANDRVRDLEEQLQSVQKELAELKSRKNSPLFEDVPLEFASPSDPEVYRKVSDEELSSMSVTVLERAGALKMMRDKAAMAIGKYNEAHAAMLAKVEKAVASRKKAE